jgi:hypothetical protein
MVDLLKPDVGKRTKHKIYKDFKEEEDKAIQFQNIDSLECKDVGEAIDMFNHAYRNQLLYNEDLGKEQSSKSVTKDHTVFVVNIDYTDTIKNKHFTSKLFLMEMTPIKEKIVDTSLLNSLQSKYLYLVGCLSPNALD